MGKRIIQQARGKGSFTYRVKRKAYGIKLGFPREQGKAKVIRLFGNDYWGPDGDEAFFFILAVLVLPALFIIGSIGSIILLVIKRSAKA